jgi:hypothetical protein
MKHNILTHGSENASKCKGEESRIIAAEMKVMRKIACYLYSFWSMTGNMI